MADLLSVDSTTGKVNVRPGVQPDFDALRLHGSPLDLPGAHPIWIFAASADFTPETLLFAASYDLKDFVQLSKFQHSIGMRDPQLIFYRGKWYCFYTQGNTTRQHLQFGYIVSENLIDWSTVTINVAATHFASGSQEIWQPIPAFDANGELYVLATATSDIKILLLRPSDPSDLSTLGFVSFVTMDYGSDPFIQSQSAFYEAGTYYIGGMDAQYPQTRRLYSSTSLTGPYTKAATLSAFGPLDALELTVDHGDWYGFFNSSAAGGPPNYRKSVGGYTSFGDIQYGRYRRFVNSPGFGYLNPQCRRYRGMAALAGRAALEEAVQQAVPSGFVTLGPDSVTSAVSENGAYVLTENWGGKCLNSGSTANGRATVTICNNVSYNGFLGNAPGMNNQRQVPIDFRGVFDYGWNNSNSPMQIIFGVRADHLGDPDKPCVGLRFKSLLFATGTVDLMVHDGTSWSAVATYSDWNPGILQSGLLHLRILIDGAMIIVWLWGKEILRGPYVPVAAIDAIQDNSYQALVLQLNYSGTGDNTAAWFMRGELRWFEK